MGAAVEAGVDGALVAELDAGESVLAAADSVVDLAGRGRVDAVSVEVGAERVVSAAHVVAFEERADVTVERSGALEDATPTCRIRGPATVWVGTRRAPARRSE